MPSFTGVAVTERFFGKRVDVKVAGEPRQPVSFTLDDREYVVEEVLVMWHDYGFGAGARGQKRWWQRHHRNYYRVRTASGEVFELYYDRGASLKSPQHKGWYLTKKLSG